MAWQFTNLTIYTGKPCKNNSFNNGVFFGRSGCSLTHPKVFPQGLGHDSFWVIPSFMISSDVIPNCLLDDMVCSSFFLDSQSIELCIFCMHGLVGLQTSWRSYDISVDPVRVMKDPILQVPSQSRSLAINMPSKTNQQKSIPDAKSPWEI